MKLNGRIEGRTLALALTFALLVGPPPARLAAQQAEVAPSTQAMVDRLQNVARNATLGRNIVLNSRRAELFRRLAETAEMPQKFSYQVAYATELLQAGQTRESIDAIAPLLKTAESLYLAQPIQALKELLGIAYLRLAEQQNCLMNHHATSCILPIERSGEHEAPEGSTQAFAIYLDLLETYPDNLEYRWLLNVAAMTLGRYPDEVPKKWVIPPAAFVSDAPMTRFVDTAPELGLAAVGLSGGTVVDDFTGDGLFDVVVSSWGQLDQLRFFANDGTGHFEERTTDAGLVGLVGGLNVVHADYDNDADLDLFVLRGAWLDFFGQGDVPNSLLQNQGNGTFVDVTESSGLLAYEPSQVAAWADFDSDGDLDLFVGNESVGDHQHPSRLYQNQGDGTFVDVAPLAGLDVIGVVKGAAWGDYDDDGQVDLFVSRFSDTNLLFRNVSAENNAETGTPSPEVSRRFVDVTTSAGVSEPKQSFATWFWDFDNDGKLDLLAAPFLGFNTRSLAQNVSNYLSETRTGEYPRLYRNRGNGTFEDVSLSVGLSTPLLAMGAGFGDLDNDGFLDAYFGTGEPYLGTLVPNRMYRNDRGQRFQDVTSAGGFGHLQKGHGVAFVDIDSDGDQDVYAVMGGAYEGDYYPNVLFENPGNQNAWVGLELRSPKGNRYGHGARVEVSIATPSGSRSIYSSVGNGSSFGSSAMRLSIGLGDASSIERVTVRWPTGTTEHFRGVSPNAYFRLNRETGIATRLEGLAPGVHPKPAPHQ